MTDEEIEENRIKFNAEIDKINSLTTEQLNELINNNKCPYPSQFMIGVPIGMFHCELCGEMLVAGVPHLRYLSSFDTLSLHCKPSPLTITG